MSKQAFFPRAPRMKVLAAALSIALAGGLGTRDEIALAASRSPTTRLVDNMRDSGSGSLRQALSEAVDGDVIDLRNLQGTMALASALEPAATVTLIGPGRNLLLLDGGGKDRVLSTRHSLTLSNVSVSHGIAPVKSAFAANGGCILSTGDLTLINTTISGCHAGAGAGSGSAAGGGVSASSLTMISSTISNCTADGGASVEGGGFFAAYFAHLTDSTISGNRATAADAVSNGSGGGGYSNDEIYLSNSSVSGNSVSANATAVGGGVYSRQGYFYDANYSTAINISNSTITGNSAASGTSGSGGGIAAGVARSGGNRFAINNSTIAFNTASSSGGGIAVSPTSAFAAFSSLIANNTATGDASSADVFSSIAITPGGDHNLIMAAGANITLPGGTLHDDPLLKPLANNGGPTLTHALSAGSPAIDAGSNPAGLATDQRGGNFRRESGPQADIGAFETVDTLFKDGFEPPVI